jgi:hypothetical protein
MADRLNLPFLARLACLISGRGPLYEGGPIWRVQQLSAVIPE